MASTLTPNKSFVSVTRQGKSIRHAIKFIGQKGTFIYSLTCDTCSYQGKVQDGLMFGGLSPTCDRDGETWRKQGRHFYNTAKHCKFLKLKTEVQS